MAGNPARRTTAAAVIFRDLTLPVAAGYFGIYIFLDWISYFHALAPLNITPWSPASGLGFALLLAWGPRAVPLVGTSLVVADLLLRGHGVALWAILAADAWIACVYGLAAWTLRRHLRVDVRLESLRDVAWLVAMGALAAAVMALVYALFFIHLGVFSPEWLPVLVSRFWVGEVIGISVLTPLALVQLRRGPQPVRARIVADAILQGGAVLACLAIVFGLPAGAEWRLFYVLFMPGVWVAVRHGLEGASLAVAGIQVGLIVALQLEGSSTSAVISFQLLMLAFTATILFLGAVVSERRSVEARFREQQAVLAHASRLTEAGAMASGLAHELNQPLAAAISYARAGRKIAAAEGVSPQVQDMLEKTIAQAERADQVIRGLRAFLSKGDARRSAVDTGSVLLETLALVTPEARQRGVALETEIAPNLPPIRADRVQVQQVLVNLVRNAIEAMKDNAGRPRRVWISARQSGPEWVEVAVRDTGPGIAQEMDGRLFKPFATTKPEGMGLGLAIAQGIIEAHGGTLWVEPDPDGGSVFRFAVPVALDEEEETDE